MIELNCSLTTFVGIHLQACSKKARGTLCMSTWQDEYLVPLRRASVNLLADLLQMPKVFWGDRVGPGHKRVCLCHRQCNCRHPESRLSLRRSPEGDSR